MRFEEMPYKTFFVECRMTMKTTPLGHTMKEQEPDQELQLNCNQYEIYPQPIFNERLGW